MSFNRFYFDLNDKRIDPVYISEITGSDPRQNATHYLRDCIGVLAMLRSYLKGLNTCYLFLSLGTHHGPLLDMIQISSEI